MQQSSQPLPNSPEQAVRTMQIIAGALMMGLMTFGCVTIVLNGSGEPKAPQQPLLTYMGAGLALLLTLTRFAIVPFITKSQISALTKNRDASGDASEWKQRQPYFMAYQTGIIIGFAMLEGPGFFNLIAYLSEGQTLSLGVVAGLLLLMAATFPTRGKIDSWVDDQLRLKQFEGE